VSTRVPSSPPPTDPGSERELSGQVRGNPRLLSRGPAPSVADVNEYMVERYLPGITTGQLDAASARLAAAAATLAAQGVEVRYVGSTFIPEEESCFCRFESANAKAVRLACEQAGIPFARIVETHDFSPKTEEQ
jgi:hypothetical protein